MRAVCLSAPKPVAATPQAFKLPRNPHADTFRKFEKASLTRVKQAGASIQEALKKTDKEVKALFVAELREIQQLAEEALLKTTDETEEEESV